MENQKQLIRSLTSCWFECFIRYNKTMENGSQKVVTEVYTVNALSFTEAEARIKLEMQPYVSSFEVKNINPATYKEIFFSDDPEDDRWYLARLDFITIDEITEKVNRSRVSYLIQAATFDRAKAYVNQVMQASMNDYVIHSIKETKILDVYTREFVEARSSE